MLATFDALVLRIEQISTGTSQQASPAATTAAPEAAAEKRLNEKRPDEKHAASITPLFRTEAASEPEIAVSAAPKVEAPHVSPVVMDEAVALPDVAEVEDQAVLDIIAMEMAAPDLSEPEDLGYDAPTADLVATNSVAETSVIPDIATRTIAAVAIDNTAQQMPTSAARIVAQEVLIDTPQPPSLGAALIAGGVVPDPVAPAKDLLAPIRRMTQAEKIALFS